MSEEWTGEIKQRGICVVLISGPSFDEVMREMAHYAVQYAEDGPIEEMRVFKSSAAPAGAAHGGER